MKLFTLLALVFLTNCADEKQKYPRLEVEKHNSILSINSKVMNESDSPILAINFKRDTLIFSDVREMFYYNDRKFDTVQFVKHKNIKDIKVIIDTTYNFSNRGFTFRNIPWITKKESQSLASKTISESIKISETIYGRYSNQVDSIKNLYVKSYPVLIYNSSNLDIHFESNRIKIIQEALDLDNKWKPIEFVRLDNSCVGHETVSFILSPKHFLATAIIKYSGDFKTKVRVNFLFDNEIIYSNTVTGYINRTQFDRKPAEDYLRARDKNSIGEWFEKDLSWMFNKPVKQ